MVTELNRGEIEKKLAAARLYLCTDARTSPQDFRTFVRAAFDGGVDIIQLRDKEIEAADELATLEILADEAARADALYSVNDRADIAATSNAHVLHVGQRDLTPAQVRALGLRDVIIGRSTHDETQMRQALTDPDVDYFCTGPIWATPTKPGRSAAGLELVRAAAEQQPSKPWFAIGGIDADNVDEVIAAGATRVVVVRAITQADDPRRAAAQLRSRLDT